jgi:hypothetical protein
VWASLCEMLETNFRERRPLTNFGKHAKRAAPWEVRRLSAKVDRCDFTVLHCCYTLPVHTSYPSRASWSFKPSAHSECLWTGRMPRGLGWSYWRTRNSMRTRVRTLWELCTMIPIKALR